MSEEPQDPADVVPLWRGIDLDDPGADRERALSVVPKYGKDYCAYHGYRAEIDAKTERAFCRDCGDEVPLFEVLTILSRDPERWIAERKDFKRRRDQALRDLEDAERLERNAKARLRTLRKKGAVPSRQQILGLVERGRHLYPKRPLAVFVADEETRVVVLGVLEKWDKIEVLVDVGMSAGSYRVAPRIS